MLAARRALISVSDKRGLLDLARGLAALGVELISTGGTHRTLEEAGIAALAVADVTHFPEILGGRVKTLHPMIHGGILADRSRANHLTELHEHGISPIDLVVVNLYPFRETVGRQGASPTQIVEMIDIGGPTMLRAAAKNHQGVVVVVDPDDYPQILAALEEGDGVVPEAMRRSLAAKAFRHTQGYDAAIAAWMERRDAGAPLGRRLELDLVQELRPRYGENPHQEAAVYRPVGGNGLFGGFEQLQGKELSFNNVLDSDAARRLVGAFSAPAVAIVKHNNPCGVGLGKSLEEAYSRALACDPVSAFGSIVAVNGVVEQPLAESLADLFVEVVVAPGYSEAALRRLEAKAALRLLRCPTFSPESPPIELRSVDGGIVAQVADTRADDPSTFRCVTRRKPTAAERRALSFAWECCRHVKSNAVVVTNEGQTVGIGAGQMSRVDSCRLAIGKAQLPLDGCVAGSDAFFPFRDGIDLLAQAGIRAVIQPGGSKRDDEVIAAADEHGVAMLLTGVRHFRH